MRKLRKERILAAVRLQPLPMVNPEETQDMKTQDTGPRESMGHSLGLHHGGGGACKIILLALSQRTLC